jgi:hypothetical protein
MHIIIRSTNQRRSIVENNRMHFCVSIEYKVDIANIMMLTSAGLYLLRNRLYNLFCTNSNDCGTTSDSDNIDDKQSSVETFDMIEQIPIAIRDFSSQYGSNRSDSYVVSNICSKPEIYPLYGDSTHALVFRTYGPWWMIVPSYKIYNKYYTRWENHFTSRDFVDIEFQHLVHQCISLNIYETYNPGALQVVYAGEEDQHGQCVWHRVWTFPQSCSIVLSNGEEIPIEQGSLLVIIARIKSNMPLFIC